MDQFGRFDGMELKLLRVRAGLRQYRVAQELGIPPRRCATTRTGGKPSPSGRASAFLLPSTYWP